MLRYEEMTERWFPLANNLPPDLVNVRGYRGRHPGQLPLHCGGYRITQPGDLRERIPTTPAPTSGSRWPP